MPAPRDHRLKRLDDLEGEVSGLVARARHQRLLAVLAMAKDQLREARALLDEACVESSPATLAIIDMDLALVEYRVGAVRVAMLLHGENAAGIG